ncbi:MAG TPA: hypothetical protein PK970_00700 [Hyphomicrobiaceae bacterium]|nr:hypothetical protein [Hyphomicrobiaceae bacterium]
MPKWAERAKRVMSSKGRTTFAVKSLQETVEQSNRIVDDIRFIMDSSGRKLTSRELSVELLTEVETFYRESAKDPNDKVIVLGIENFERLLAVLLGQWIAKESGGKWVAYDGKHHVYDPVVVKLPNGKYLDVFLFCKHLCKKSGVPGASTGTSLTAFASQAQSMAFP